MYMPTFHNNIKEHKGLSSMLGCLPSAALLKRTSKAGIALLLAVQSALV
jgi:hypothetical protein